MIVLVLYNAKLQCWVFLPDFHYTNGNMTNLNGQSWVAGTTTNDGWMLRDSVECSAACTAQSSTYDSNDITCGTAFTCNPQLIIVYKPVP